MKHKTTQQARQFSTASPAPQHLKLVLYGINFSPELTGIGKYTGDMAAWLAAQGHEVRVVTAPPYYPDVVWVVAPALFCAPGAWLAARLGGAKAWLHIQDYEVDAAFDLGLIKGRQLKRCVAWVERLLMRRFDMVSTISHRMVDRAIAKGVDIPRTKLFPNWVDVQQLSSPSAPKVEAYRASFGLRPGALVALYSGSMGAKQGLDALAEVARSMLADEPASDGNVVFVFCGNGSGRQELLKLCQDEQGRRFPNVRFLDLQPAEDLVHFLAAADIHLLPQRADAADLVMPSKLTGMLASARPIVATAKPGTELATVVNGRSAGREDDACGLVVAPEDASAIEQAIKTLAADPALRTRLGRNGLRYAQQHLDRDAVLRQFTRTLQTALHRTRPPPAVAELQTPPQNLDNTPFQRELE